jgi:EmrB/QacA subfamily drug resistance transporter
VHAPDRPRLITRADLLALIASAAFFMELLDATIIVPAIPQMAASFGTNAVALSSGITAYLITVAIFIPASAWLSERFGARNVFATAIFVFTVASVLCGLSQTLTEFTLARILQGIGGAMMSPVGRLEILRRTEKAQLLRAIAFLTWPGLTAFAVGPPLGGFFATYVSWPWIFFMNVPIGIIGIVLVLTFFDKGTDAPRRPFDVLGFTLAGGALASLLYGLERLSRAGGWLDGIIFLILGFALGVSAIRHARRHPSPLLPLAPLSIQTFRVGNLNGGGFFRAQVGAIGFMLPVMCQLGLGYSAFESGLLIFVFLMGDLTAKFYANQLIRYFGFKTMLIGGGILIALSLVPLMLVGPDTLLWILLIVLFAAGAIRSVHFSAVNSLTFADVPQQQMHFASTLTSMILPVTMASGVSLAALSLAFSAAARGAGELALVDFRITIGVSLLLVLVSIVFYVSLPAKTGADVSGHSK